MLRNKPQLHSIELTGLDGSNLLGFMAALGTLRTLAMAASQRTPPALVKLAWKDASGWWMPVLQHSVLQTAADVAEELGACLCGDNRDVEPAFLIAKDLTLTPEQFRSAARQGAESASPSERSTADFLAAFACDACQVKDHIEDTGLRTMSGAGHQHFLGFMAELSALTTTEDLKKCLFEPWRYEDDRPAMRWDPADYRPYALRATNPSKDAIKTVRGANRLALEALPFFPTMPGFRGLETTGFARQDRDVTVSWPIWVTPLDAPSVRAALAYAELTKTQPSYQDLAPRGIEQVFRARRFTDDKYRNFSPARELL